MKENQIEEQYLIASDIIDYQSTVLKDNTYHEYCECFNLKDAMEAWALFKNQYADKTENLIFTNLKDFGKLKSGRKYLCFWLEKDYLNDDQRLVNVETLDGFVVDITDEEN